VSCVAHGWVCGVLQVDDCDYSDDAVVVGSSSRGRSLSEQNVELRRRLNDEHAQYRRQLHAYHDQQQRHALLVQTLHAQVSLSLSLSLCCLLVY